MVDLADVRGQETPKRVLEIAAAGDHSCAIVGAPGTGKSMLAACAEGLGWPAREVGVDEACEGRIILTARPCPCGNEGECACELGVVERYRRRLESLPVELWAGTHPVSPADLARRREHHESSEVVRARIGAARARAAERGLPNRELPAGHPALALAAAGESLMDAAERRLGITPAMVLSTLRVARTIADLRGHEQIGTSHLAEAMQYRRFRHEGD